MISAVKVTILIDNTSIIGEEYAPGGFSAFVECLGEGDTGKVILFDTGLNAEFMKKNAERLGIDFGGLEWIVLSHGHFDHSGGLEYVLENSNDRVKVLCHPDALIEKNKVDDDGSTRNIGMPISGALRKAQGEKRVIAAPGVFRLDRDMWTTGEIPRITDFEKPNPDLLKVRKGKIENGRIDPLIDDISLVIELNGGQKILLCGCCHAGIVNTVNFIQRESKGDIVSILGGLQLYRASPDVLEKTADGLAGLPLRLFSPMHSSGEVGFDFLRERFGDIVKKGGVGAKFEIRGE